jgi:hypothetical protein
LPWRKLLMHWSSWLRKMAGGLNQNLLKTRHCSAAKSFCTWLQELGSKVVSPDRFGIKWYIIRWAYSVHWSAFIETYPICVKHSTNAEKLLRFLTKS